MKVHRVPRKGNIALRYDVASAKKLLRLPQVFAKVLELPFHSNALVSISETTDSLRFSAAADGGGGDVRTDAVEIHPGITKIVVRGGGVGDWSGSELELDLWRFRLPELVRPDLASAAYEGGELVVTVPKEDDVAADRLLFV